MTHSAIRRSENYEFRVWDPKTAKPGSEGILCGVEHQSRDICLSPSGHLIAGLSHNTIRFWESERTTPTGPIIEHPRPFHCFGFAPSGDRLLAGSADKHVYVWDVATGQLAADPIRHASEVRQIVFSPVDKTVALLGTRSVQLLRRGRWTPIGEPLQHRLKVVRLTYSPDGQTLATASEERLIRFWNTRTGRPRRMPPLETGGWIHSLAYSPDGTFLVTGNEPRIPQGTTSKAQIWSVRTGSPIGPPIQHNARSVILTRFSADSKLVVTGGSNGFFKVTSVSDFRLLTTLEHPSACYSAEFDPQGSQFVTSCTDGFARLWNTNRWREGTGG